MGKTTSQIEHQIDCTRDELGSNLHELERKVKSAADWKHHFRNNPGVLLGASFGIGLLCAATLGGGGRRRYYRYGGPSPEPVAPRPPASKEKKQVLEAWDTIKGALIAVAATRVKEYVGQAVPGFKEQFDHLQQKKVPSS